MNRAAGIMIAAAGQVLLLKRGAGGDHEGEWCFPGGHIEDGETEEQAAIRETAEECGYVAESPLDFWTRRIDPEVDFTTFIVHLPEPFTPTLSDEHTGFMWLDPKAEASTEVIHPGCAIALERLGMTEHDVAQAIADGRLTSPQRVGNFYLFDIRITGTGTSFRAHLKEFVYRKPSDYLTPTFLARCNGLPVIFEHTEDGPLNSAEFAQRMVGTCALPYIKGDEVWAIAKIYDAGTIQLMLDEKLSTSPGVWWTDATNNNTLLLDDGNTLLIEDEPQLLDHIAICEVGVWDKGGPPAGIVAEDTIGAVHMTEEERAAADKARKDAAEKEESERKEREDAERRDAASRHDATMGALDAVMKACDALGKRMDAYEAKDSAEGETEEEKKAREDKARKDADEKEAKEAKEREDAARKDSAAVNSRIDDLNRRIPLALTDEDYAALSVAQSRYDSVSQLFGKPASKPMAGETPLGYRRRMAGELKVHSPACKSIEDLSKLDSASFDVIEKQIIDDAVAVAKSPAALPKGMLRPIHREDAAGRRITSYVGDIGTTFAAFKVPSRQMRLKSASDVRQGN
jgi:8-oxo-dGTP pyrophosphatase MutT (NUDIX family)